MRWLTAKILWWCLGTLALSLVAFLMVSRFVMFRSENNPFARMDLLVFAEAQDSYKSGGSAKLAEYMAKVQGLFQAQRYFTDTNGKDLVTGEDRSDWLRLADGRWGHPRAWNGHMLVTHASGDGHYRLIVLAPPPIKLWSLAPYYALIFAAVALLCWALAFSIASPLRILARAVDRFGHGDLAVRINSARRDELGELARAFDRMAERIETLVTAERRLLQDVSHELRSPLARMSFAAELIKTAGDRDAAVARLQKEIQRLTDLVGTLLQVTRTEGDPSTTNAETFLLDDLVHEVAEDCSVEASARGCRITVGGVVEVPVCGDRELLRRAIENIVRNAIRYAPEGSTVDVQLQAIDSTTRITVRDYGEGVPEEFLDKIFQPFFRVDDSRNNSTGGAGLGLAIARRAIGVHHGTLRAENVNPGLRVSIELPRTA